MEIVSTERPPRLTIISKGLLRVTTEEWRHPEKVFQCLGGNALELLLAPTIDGVEVNQLTKRTVLLFDRLLSVIGEPKISSALAFATPRFRTLQTLFYGALGSDLFLEAARASRLNHAYNFGLLMKQLGRLTDVLLPDHNQKVTGAIPVEFIEAFEQQPLDKEKIRALRPYFLQDKDGLEYNVSLGGMLEVLGKR